MKISSKKNKIIVEINKWQTAHDAIGQKVGKIPNIIGVAYQDEDCNQQLGFSYLLDRSYKGKGPDISVPFLYVNSMKKEEFIDLCEKDLEIEFYEYPRCAYCGQDIYGGCTVGEKGDMCLDCEYTQKDKCYFCGKSASKHGRVKEDIKTERGILVPVCESCWNKFWGEHF